MDRRGNAGLVALTILVTAGVVSGAFVFSGIVSPTAGRYSQYNASSFFSGESTGELRKFASPEEFQAFFSVSQPQQRQSSFGGTRMEMAGGRSDAMVKTGGGAPSGAPIATTSVSDYSGTNVQYEGVDEADFVKTDGNYIYALSNGVLSIIRVSAGQMEKVSEIDLSDESISGYGYSSPREIFVKGNRLLVVSDSSERGFYFQKYDIMPQDYYRQLTKVSVYDITSREDPALLSNYSVSGSYYQSRMIGEKVFLVSSEYPNYYSKPMPPVIFAESSRRISPEIYYFDNMESSHQLSTVSSFDIETGDFVEAKSFLLGYSNTLMVSENAIYIAYQKASPCSWRFGGWGGCYGSGEYERARFFEVVLPLLDGDLKARIDSISSEGLSEDEEWAKISGALSDHFKGFEALEERGGEIPESVAERFERIQEALSDYDTKKALENHGTIIHKILISGETGKIDYSAKGQVPGTLLNQFSLDENGGKLRVATTFSSWISSSRETRQFNNVYVLDSGMATIGKLENLASGERIYSTRFLGDRLYMVTFRQTDPLFVIDLSADSPKVLGELKIPGFSTYLHPYGDNYLIGIGRETKEIDENRNEIQGVKISLFDVSDVSNPKEVDKFEIGTRETDSAALYEHKAFLFSERKDGLLSIPISETKYIEETGNQEILPNGKRSPYYPRYKYRIWTGAYVFKVNETGIGLAGTVEHSSFENSYFTWRSPSTVTRSFYIEDNLYTLSEKFIKSNRLFSLEGIDTFVFSEEIVPEEKYYPEYADDEIPIELTVEEDASIQQAIEMV